MELWITDAGNVVGKASTHEGMITFERIGRFDDNNDYQEVPRAEWGRISEEYFRHLTANGCWQRAVRMIGGVVVSEQAFSEGNAWRKDQ